MVKAINAEATLREMQGRAGDQLGAPVSLAEDLNLVRSTRITWLTTDLLLGSTCAMHILRLRHVHIT